jgi:deferrochelatase/peroxidase EfeB
VPFYGRHQAGIATPVQDRLAFAAFDVVTDDLDALRAMLGAWAAAGARLTAGQAVGATETHPERPPIDTGEAVDLGPARLTVTVGFGPSLFAKFGLGAHRPTLLQDLPTFRNDVIDPDLSHGDLCVQACSDDPQVAFHVVRNFARIGRGDVVMRWSQLGFGRTSATSTTQSTPRNLMGFRDGTNNIKLEHSGELDEFVWVGAEADQPWMVDGTFLVIRRIRTLIETWDNTSLREQERVIGRVKDSGAPIGATGEFDAIDFDARDEDGEPRIDVAAHIRLASPARFDGAKMLRRGYNFTDGMDPRTGRLDAGLFFIAFVRDPSTQFIPVQAELGRSDLLNEYIKHSATGIYAVPPGLAEVGDWYGKSFLA